MVTDITTLEAMAKRWEADMAKLEPGGFARWSLSQAIIDLRVEIREMTEERKAG